MKSELIFSGKGKKNILLSFVIPTYRYTPYLEEAIESIYKINQLDRIAYEVIVVSNDPNSEQTEIKRKFSEFDNLSVYRNEENYGQVNNINQCISLAKGKYVAILHDDDLLLNNYLDELLQYINDENMEYPCIIPSYYSKYENYHPDTKYKIVSILFIWRFFYREELQKLDRKDCLESFRDIYNAPTCGTIFSKKCLNKYGLFKDKHGAAWDYYNYREFHKSFDVFLLHKYVGIKRQETGMSIRKDIQQQFYEDSVSLIESEKANCSFLQKYCDVIFSKKPAFKYLMYQIHRISYYYLHNLDADKTLPRNFYNK